MCTETITRLLVFIANFLFLLVGAALLTLGILFTINYTDYTEAIPGDYQAIQYIPTIAIVIGSIVFLIAFLGCCGAVKGSICMLTTYAAILFVIFLIQIGLGVFGLLQIRNNDDLQIKVGTQIDGLFRRYNTTTDVTGVIDLIQQNLECCGASSSLWWTTTVHAIPPSCYNKDSRQLFTQGCSEAMYNFIMSSVRIIAIVALAISTTEVIGAVLALCLSNCIRSRKSRGGYYS